MPTITGNITIADLVDGVTGATIVFTNESHTFTADPDGGVTNLNDFSSDVTVYAGTTQHTFVTGTSPGTNEYAIGSITTVAGLTTSVASVSSQARLTVSDTAGVAGFADAGESNPDSALIVIPVIVNISGTLQTYNRVISLAKARGGSAKVVRVTPSRQTILYEFDATNPKSGETDIVIEADYQNFDTGDDPGEWSYRAGLSGSFVAIGSGQGTVEGTNNKTLKITPTQYQSTAGTDNVVTYRVTRDTRIDQVSIVKLRDAEGGYQVVIETTNATVFKNNNGTADLTARLYRGGTEITSGITYLWKLNGATFTPSATQESGQGTTSASVKVSAADIPDGSSRQVTCSISF
ncbi:hypothetical protein PQZ39_00960 [bacterium]|nr:hypothetical protein [bacterium]